MLGWTNNYLAFSREDFILINWHEHFGNDVVIQGMYLGLSCAVRWVEMPYLNAAYPCGYVALPCNEHFPAAAYGDLDYSKLEDALINHDLYSPHGGVTYCDTCTQEGDKYAIYGFDFYHAGDEDISVDTAIEECRDFTRTLVKLNDALSHENEQ